MASDLVVSSVTAPPTAGAGDTLTIMASTKNQGLGAAEPSATRFYLARTSTITASAILFDGVHTVPSLAAGATSSASITVTIPAASATGTYYIVAKADAGGIEQESQESNNTLARLLTIGPDVAFSVLAVPTTAAAGGTIVVADTVKNQGGGTAGVTTTTFYLSSDTSLGAGDVLSGSRSVPDLPAGGVNSGTTLVVIPPSLATGSYYVIAKADADNAVIETNESNNTSLRNVQIGGDLVVSAPTVPATAGAGSTVVVSETTTNKGAGPVAASVTRFYLSTKLVIDASAMLLSGGRAISELAGGASSTGSTTVLIPTTVSTGSYYLIAKTDADNAVSETLESNNTAARAFWVGGDLMISALTAPSTAAAGSAIMVEDTTRNQGGGAIAASLTRFYLSTNTTLDASDVLLSGYHTVPELAAGASSPGSTMVTVPAAIVAGTYYLFAKADADNSVPETQELNNTMLRAMQIGGDLLVSALTVPGRGAANAAIVITDTTTNQGAGPVPASTTRFYLSTNTTFDGSDTLLPGNRSVPELAGVAGNSGSTTVTIPTVAAGTYYVIARADADNSIVESREDNNGSVRSISIGADLIVGSVSAALTVAAGAVVSVADVVQNQGADASGPSSTKFYLSANMTLDASDVLLPDIRPVPAIAAGASSAGVTALTIPPGTAAGAYYLFAKADGDNAVVESHETNNVRFRVIQVTAVP
jgi:subtilase family serine protease